MTIQQWQKSVDGWIQQYGVRYFDVMTNTVLLMEEVGEVASLIARIYGEQSFKEPLTEHQQHQKLRDELGDVLFVLACIANQTGIDFDQIIQENIAKKSRRDYDRHRNNPKL